MVYCSFQLKFSKIIVVFEISSRAFELENCLLILNLIKIYLQSNIKMFFPLQIEIDLIDSKIMK